MRISASSRARVGTSLIQPFDQPLLMELLIQFICLVIRDAKVLLNLALTGLPSRKCCDNVLKRRHRSHYLVRGWRQRNGFRLHCRLSLFDSTQAQLTLAFASFYVLCSHAMRVIATACACSRQHGRRLCSCTLPWNEETLKVFWFWREGSWHVC